MPLVKKSLIISSFFLFNCSQTSHEQKSEALIDDFTYQEYHHNKPEWELKALSAEVFSSDRAKIKDFSLHLKTAQFPFAIQSKKGTLGEKGMTMKPPVSIQIPDYDLNMSLPQSALWDREKRMFTSPEVSMIGKSFQGRGQMMKLTHPYQTLHLSNVNFSFSRE